MKQILNVGVLAVLLCACSKGDRIVDPNTELPQGILSCETNTQEVCGLWKLEDGRYHAEWLQGSRAYIEIVKFDSDSLVFTRTDYAGPTPNMRATYRGGRDGRSTRDGVATWQNDGLTYSGPWRASW